MARVDETREAQASESDGVGVETIRSAPDGPAVPELEIGAVVDRYVVLSRVGAGAMGVVYAAYDPRLDRKVALKLLRLSGARKASARTRLQREAQALARLDHPNVVAVHDVGEHEDRVYVAMQFVDGQTVGEWMRATETPRPWPEVLAVFIDAARGLEAAHAAGLVHRDFKPDNVMIEPSGRVRVMDFGLARHEGGPEARAPDADPAPDPDDDEFAVTDGSEEVLSAALTRTGAMMGTPAYMSPEQFTGDAADARSDLFGFCISLYEALYGERPFAGSSVSALAMAVMTGDVRPAPRGSTVPASLRAVVTKGLSGKPSKRWASMRDLIDALEAERAPAPQRRWAWPVAGAVAVVGLIAVATPEARIYEAPAVCPDVAAPMDAAWSSAARDDLRRALMTAEVTYAEDTATRVADELDRWAGGWVDARRDACEDTHTRGEQSAELLDLRMACLDDRLREFVALRDVLTTADASVVDTVVERAARAVAALPPVAPCEDREYLRARVRPPDDPALAQTVAALSDRLAAAVALQVAGKPEASLTAIEAVAAEAETIEFEPIRARVASRLGLLQDRTGDSAGAETTLSEAFHTALRVGWSEVAIECASQLAFVVGVRLGRIDEGRRWGKLAEALEIQARGALGGGLLNNLALIEHAAGELDAALELQTRALAARRAELGETHLETATNLNNLGVVEYGRGNLEAARAHWERAMEIQSSTLGPEHPGVAVALNNLAVIAGITGRLDDARRFNERALGIWTKTVGPEHPRVATTLNNLGTAELDAGLVDEALAHFERGLSIREKTVGPDHPDTASSLENLGNVAVEQRRYDDARGFMQRALDIRRARLEPGHPRVAASVSAVARVALAQERFDEAIALEREAIAAYEKAVGPDHPDLSASLTGLGEALVGAGRAADAIAPLERAVTIRVAHDVDPARRAESEFALARALADAPAARGGDPGRAVELARKAAETYRSLDREAAALGRVEAWLSAR